MLALVSVVLLAAAPTLFAAPLLPQPHAGWSHPYPRRRACNNKTTHTSSFLAPTTTMAQTHSVTSTSSAQSTPSTSSTSLTWPVSVSNAKAIWSTDPDVPKHVELNDAALNIYSGASTPHVYDNAPDGTPALRAFYEKGSVSPGHTPDGLTGGFSLYSKTGIDLSKGTEILFSYKAYFQNDFDFNKGGKMPGLYGGINDVIAKTCSGGNHGENECWSARMMFRPGGAGELYSYFPVIDSNTNELAKQKIKTIANAVYGDSVGRGSFHWKRGAWTTIAQRIKLNDVGQTNGEFQVWADGVSIMDISGLVFRTSKESLVRGAQLETFFGGHDHCFLGVAPKPVLLVQGFLYGRSRLSEQTQQYPHFPIQLRPPLIVNIQTPSFIIIRSTRAQKARGYVPPL